MKQAFAILVMTLLLVSCSRRDTTTDKKEQVTDIPLRVTKVEKRMRTVQVTGAVRATVVANLGSRFGGYVSQVPAREGMKVNKGELLVLMDQRNLAAQSAKVKAAGEEVDLATLAAKQQLAAAEAQKTLAAATFERIRNLYEKQAASRQEYDEAESRSRAAEANYNATREAVAQAEAKRRQVQADMEDVDASMDYVRIVAPFNGVVATVTADPGTFVNPGQQMVVVEDPSAYQVIFSIEEELLDSVKSRESIPVSIPAISGQRFMAHVAEISPLIDGGTRTFRVKADLPHNSRLRSGLSATIELGAGPTSTLWIPTEYLSRARDVETVMVRDQNEWRRVLVKSGREQSGKVEILSGLKETDEVGLFEAES